MPSWRLHLITGVLLTAVLIYSCFYLGLGQFFIHQNQVQMFFILHIGFITILGSLFPDFDYRKTRIRHTIGPMLAIFVVISYVYLNHENLTVINPVFILLLFLVFFFLPYIFGLVLPLRHHGKLHSIAAAGCYFVVWLVLELAVFQMPRHQAGLIALFGFLGYCSHLLLDVDLKWF